MRKKAFKAESKRLLDLMINSIYTNKEIFLRELISNASDAIDKLYYKSLTDPSVGMNKGDFRILITRDKENRILTVEDNGIGMTKEELEQNGKQSQKQSAGKNKYPAEGSLEKGRGCSVTEPGADGQLWKIDAEGTVRQVRGNEERAGAGTAG